MDANAQELCSAQFVSSLVRPSLTVSYFVVAQWWFEKKHGFEIMVHNRDFMDALAESVIPMCVCCTLPFAACHSLH